MSFSLRAFIDQYTFISILTHRNPDADTIGTALGIYSLLKEYGKTVEVVSVDQNVPKNLDFLPYYQKIKHQIDYQESLIISCDSGSIDLLGFDLSGRDILNIDHHKSNTRYGLVNVVNPHHPAASCVAYELFKEEFTINKAAATCFYTALVTDTQYFTTKGVTKETFDIASDMITFDINISEVAYNLKQRRSLASLRFLTLALQSLELCCDGKIAMMVATQKDVNASGAKSNDHLGIVEYGLSLATVEMAIFISEWEKHIRVSIQSKNIDVSALAIAFGGGGHHNAAGFHSKPQKIDILIKNLKNKIKELRLLNGT